MATLRNSAGDTLTGRRLTWASSAPEIATVSSAGLVTVLAAGQTIISASSEQRVGLARLVVQEDFNLPLPGGRHWLLLTEVGTPTRRS
jgi:hypothetical protein